MGVLCPQSANGRNMLVRGFDQACSVCHTPKILETLKGGTLAFLRLPKVPVLSLETVGEWPAAMQEGADDTHIGLSNGAECRQQPAEIGALTAPVQHRLPVNSIEIHHGYPVVLRVANQVLQLQVPVAQTVSV